MSEFYVGCFRKFERTHTCGELRESNVGQRVVVDGLGREEARFRVLTFIDLRDREGVTQVVFSARRREGRPREGQKYPRRIRHRRKRRGRVAVAKGTHNAKLATGNIEIRVDEILILNDAKVPPFQLEVAGSENLASEDTRLKYRYLDLRRPQLQNNIRMRAKAVKAIREYFDDRGFIGDRDADTFEIDT